ncbi:response regulator [bacterium]|nr:response regulator [bacterium]
MSDLVGMSDTNLKITFVSPSHETILGYPISHYLGKSALDFVHKDDIPAVMEKAIASTQRNEDTIVEYRTNHIDGHYIWFEANIKILLDEDERMIGGVFNSRDITERKRAEESLIKAKETAEKANKAKDNFMATMSHELRTPLNGVLGIAKLLLLSEMNEQQRKHLESIFNSGNALLKVLDSVLDLARIEANKFELEIVDFDLRKTVDQVIQLFSGSAEIKGVELVYEIKDDVPTTLKGDHNRVGQVLSNIIANALKFTEKGSIVLVVSALEKKKGNITLRFEISDTGIGISKDKLSHIFQSFTQVDSSTTRKYGGTGLGLTIARSIIDLMGGKIGVESELDRGSDFWFEIPFGMSSSTMDKIPESTENQQETDIISRADYKILIVEDDLVSQQVITGMLKQLGYKPSVSPNGMEALDKITRTSYDLVFMDCLMPEMDGFETTRLVRNHEKSLESSKQVPIIALTAKAMKGDREQCLTAGMNDYLTKPLFLHNLQRVLHKFLS